MEKPHDPHDTPGYCLALRPYRTRNVVSLSLARTQRILELHTRIAERLRSLPESDWQRSQNVAIARRAELMRAVRELEVKMWKAEKFSAFWELKNKWHVAMDALDMFDRNMEAVDLSARTTGNVDFCHGI